MQYKLQHGSHLPAAECNCMIQCQAVQGFPDVSEVLLRKSDKINLPVL